MTYSRQRGRARYRRTGTGSRVLRNRRRPNYLLFFCIFVLMATVAGSVSYVLTTPSLDVAKVDIKGFHLVDKAAIEKLAGPAIGHNIILCRTGPILGQVRCVNEIRQVKMGRRFPDRLWLRVWERKADAVLAADDGLYLAQADGFVFHKVSAPVKDVPLIAVTGEQKLVPGKMAQSRSIRSALEVLGIARRQRIKLGKISVDPRGDICLNMGSEFCVKLGQPDDIAHKMSLLRHALLSRPSIVRDGAYMDLSIPSDPVWKPKVAALVAS